MRGVTKTGSEVQGDVLRFLRGSGLAAEAKGAIYRSGLRPADRAAEDIVVAFTAGLPGEVQSGAVTVMIFVPDVVLPSGRAVADGARCATLEAAAAAWVAGLTCAVSGGYRFWLQSAIRTVEDAEGGSVRQHFVVVKLGYDFYE